MQPVIILLFLFYDYVYAFGFVHHSHRSIVGIVDCGAVDFNSTNVNSSQTVSTMRTSTSLEVNLPSSYGNGNQHSTGTTLRERGRRGGKDLTINDNESRRNNAAKNRRRASRKNHSAGGSSTHFFGRALPQATLCIWDDPPARYALVARRLVIAPGCSYVGRC